MLASVRLLSLSEPLLPFEHHSPRHPWLVDSETVTERAGAETGDCTRQRALAKGEWLPFNTVMETSSRQLLPPLERSPPAHGTCTAGTVPSGLRTGKFTYIFCVKLSISATDKIYFGFSLPHATQ